MKILAIEREIGKVDWSQHQQVLRDEAAAAYQLYKAGIVREMYFNEAHSAVLCLECKSKDMAFGFISQLPIVKAGLVAFDIMELNPYTGYERLMQL